MDGVELDVEDGLFDSTRQHVSGETDHLLGPDERVREVICHGTKAFVAKHGEFVQPWVIDEARVAQPIDRELGMVGIRNDSRNDSDLSAKDKFVISYRRSGRGVTGRSGTHVGAGFWAGGVMEEGFLGRWCELRKVFFHGLVR